MPLKPTELKSLVEKPIKFYHCPSRRTARLYPITVQPHNAAPVSQGAKLDYAVNCGDGGNERDGGSPTQAASDPATFPGIHYDKSKVRLADITDGLSNTIMVGEKYLNPDNYATGNDAADNENLYVGFDNDNSRSTGIGSFPPRQDKRLLSAHIFGSAHASGFQVVLCDGSVRMIAYTIDQPNYQYLGNRMDGENIKWNF
jgi:hypothetical protein